MKTSGYIFFREMKMKYILFFIIFLVSIPLECQTWEFLYQEDFLNNDKLMPNGLTIKGDTVAISREQKDTMLLFYNIQNKNWNYFTKEYFKSKFGNDSIFENFILDFTKNLIFDKFNNLWGSFNSEIFCLSEDTMHCFTHVFDKNNNDSFKIVGIRDIKIDKTGNIWAIAPYKDEITYIITYCLVKLKNDKFYIIDYPTANYALHSKKSKISFDSRNRVWHTHADTIYLIANEEIVRKFCIQEFPQGSGYFTETVIDKNDVFYTLCNNLNLFIYDGTTFQVDTFLYWQERELLSGLQEGIEYQMCLDSSGNIWINGFSTCFLYRRDPHGVWTIFPYPDYPEKADGNCWKFFTQCDANGKLYIPLSSNVGSSYGIYIFDPNGTSPVEEPPQKIESGALPDVWLYNLYPNPADGSTTIEFFLARAQKQTLNASVCSILGERTLNITPLLEYDDYNQRGKITFSTDGLAGGAYFVLVSAGDTKKLKLLMVAK